MYHPLVCNGHGTSAAPPILCSLAIPVLSRGNTAFEVTQNQIGGEEFHKEVEQILEHWQREGVPGRTSAREKASM